ncbi:MAG: acyltransferase family protein [Verrucomicrobiales bacterium]
MLIENFRYRPEIDGLRALAVTSVVLYHAGLGVSGGFIGVDVFFVISGFLISSLILKDLENGVFHFSEFWERRARRILPAATVLVLTVLLAGWFLFPPADYASLGRSAVWQALFGANIHFWRETGYFQGAAEEKPLLHTWSLAVEEQFYMVVPFVLFLLFRFRHFRSSYALMSIVGIGLLGSLALSVVGVGKFASATFYLLPTRAWELLCGTLVAILPRGQVFVSGKARSWVAFAALGMILVPCWLYDKTTPFPGLAALPPCVGTAVFIWLCKPGSSGEPLPLAARMLASRPVVFVGLVSYSWYLWHWPVFAFHKYWELQPPSLAERLWMTGLGFVCAVVSWKYVETPFRTRSLCVRRGPMLLAGAGSLAGVLVVGLIVVGGGGFSSRYSARALACTSAMQDVGPTAEMSAEIVKSGDLPLLGKSDSSAAVSLLLWGDSHAMAAAPGVDKYLADNGLAGRMATMSATAPFADYVQNEVARGDAEQKIAFNRAVLEYIKDKRVPTVLIAGYWEHYSKTGGSRRFDDAMVGMVREVVATGARPYVMLQVPHQKYHVPRGLAQMELWSRNLTGLVLRETEWDGFPADAKALVAGIQAAGGVVLDPASLFVDHATRCFRVESDGMILYRDSHHMTASGSRAMLPMLLGEEMNLKPGPQETTLHSVEDSGAVRTDQ